MERQSIEFICYGPDEKIFSQDRKQALSMVKKGLFKKYKCVVVNLGGIDRFNLRSKRGLGYFGIKERGCDFL